MNKFLGIFTAGALAVAMSGLTCAADKGTSQQGTQNAHPSGQAGPSDRPASEASDKGTKPDKQNDNDVYSATLKKCYAIGDATAQEKCIRKAQKVHRQM